MTEPAHRESRIGSLELIGAMVLSGTIGLFVVESGASPFTVVFFRCLFGAVFLGIYCLVRGFFRDHGLTRATLAMALLGGVFIVFNWVFLFEAYSRTSISLATVVYHTQPFYVVLLGALVFGERLTAAKVGWVVVAFLGLVLVTDVTSIDWQADSAYLVGVGSALLAALFYAFATIIAKRLRGVRPHLVALAQVSLGVVLLAPLADFAEVSGLGAGWGWLVGLGLIHTCVLYILLYSSYQKLTTSVIAVLSFIYPAVAILVDLIAYDTRIHPIQIVGIGLIAVASLAISLGWSLGSRPTPSPTPPDREEITR